MQAKDKKADDAAAVLSAIDAMPDNDRDIAKQLHAIITNAAPDLMPRTWYGMPAYHDGSKIVCFFRSGKKFGERYMTLGFNDVAKLDDEGMWPISFAIQDLNEANAITVKELILKAVK